MYYPIMVELKEKKVTIIGGGKVAYRKANNLASLGAFVTVISPTFIEEFKKLEGLIKCIKAYYEAHFIEDSFLVIVATDNKALNAQIGEYAKSKSILCNVVTSEPLSSFIVPSTLRRGELVLSVSTCGNSPSLAHKIKKELEEKYDVTYEEYVRLLGELRTFILSKNLEECMKVKLLNGLVEMNLEELQAYKSKLIK